VKRNEIRKKEEGKEKFSLRVVRNKPRLAVKAAWHFIIYISAMIPFTQRCCLF
jgi:hypothetical protein